MLSVVDRNVVMRRVPLLETSNRGRTSQNKIGESKLVLLYIHFPYTSMIWLQCIHSRFEEFYI